MSRAKFATVAALVLSAAAWGQTAKPAGESGTAGATAAASLAPTGPTLSVTSSPAGWRVTAREVDKGATVLLFIGYPSASSFGSHVDLGPFGSVDLGLAYAGVVMVMPSGANAGSAQLFFARPDPMPPELIGLILALQAVQATPTLVPSGVLKPGGQVFDFELSQVVQVKLA